jgi:hypothetical protein
MNLLFYFEYVVSVERIGLSAGDFLGESVFGVDRV